MSGCSDEPDHSVPSWLMIVMAMVGVPAVMDCMPKAKMCCRDSVARLDELDLLGVPSYVYAKK